jgi:hypothetical protein
VPRVIELAEQPWVLSQMPLLLPEQYIGEARLRDLVWTRDHLEALHSSGLLVPLLRVEKDAGGIFTPTTGNQIRHFLKAGLVFDPEDEPFTPWSAFDEVDEFGAKRRMSEYLYSRYQLMGVNLARDARFEKIEESGRLRVAANLGLPQFAARDFVILLSAIETVQWPSIMGTLIGDFDAFVSDYLAAYDAGAMLSWLGWTAEQIEQRGHGLFFSAHMVDPLRDWEELVWLVRPQSWLKLRGDALVAMDYRIAGEMLLRFHDDVRRSMGEEVLEDGTRKARFRHPLEDRLPGDRQHLDDVLTRYGISPHPRLVMVLEGATEMTIVPEVMSLLQIPERRSVIDLHDAGGVSKDFGFLASFIALPDLGEELQPGVARLSRPLTRFLVVVDPEPPMETAEARERKRQGWVDDILRRLPREYRTSHARSTIDELLFVETWNDEGDCFEFAHFSDDELKGALLAAWPNELDRVSETALVSRVASIRRSSSQSIESLWKGWPSTPSKPDWVRHNLWPSLRNRIENLDDWEAGERIPIVRILRNAWRLAYEYPRDGLAFERDPPRMPPED